MLQVIFPLLLYYVTNTETTNQSLRVKRLDQFKNYIIAQTLAQNVSLISLIKFYFKNGSLESFGKTTKWSKLYTI